ncbi:MAG: hypothetical protein IJD04_02630 [Desulfovibrionaceae bacterium]|nr:hypothetical protein [Desulfovibrionaceae bacterium]
MFTQMQKILAVFALLLLGGCASNIDVSEQIQPYTVSNNNIAVSGGPVLKINPDYRYAGAEIIPSLSEKLKRQIYAGPNGSFLTVAVFNSSSQAVREAVTSPPNEWEFIIAQRPGPRWIRITGNKTPCCINLLRSEYIFMPCSEPGSRISPVAELPAEDIPGKLIVISYGIPLPDALVSGAWADNEAGMEFLADKMQPQLSYEDNTHASPLNPAQAAFLAEQETRAEAAWSME